jgi:hypothetical protein
MGLFDRFKKKQPDLSKRSIVDEPLIGSELFEERPISAREYLRPLRQKIQAEYLAEERDPDSLEKISGLRNHEESWMTYIDSLMVFERHEEALQEVESALAKFPRSKQLREVKMLLEQRLG